MVTIDLWRRKKVSWPERFFRQPKKLFLIAMVVLGLELILATTMALKSNGQAHKVKLVTQQIYKLQPLYKIRTEVANDLILSKARVAVRNFLVKLSGLNIPGVFMQKIVLKKNSLVITGSSETNYALFDWRKELAKCGYFGNADQLDIHVTAKNPQRMRFKLRWPWKW